MGDHCTIEWVVALARQLNAIPASLNPIRGCSRLSEACRNCYAAGIAHRFGHKGNGVYAGLTDLDPNGTPRFNGTLRWVPEVLTTAIKAKRSRVYFVCDMSDLFHARVDQDWIDQVFAMMALCRHHHFLLLTKRPDRMRRYLTDPETPRRVAVYAYVLGGQSMRAGDLHFGLEAASDGGGVLPRWPLPNVWTGATVEDQSVVADRVTDLLGCPSVRRYVSVEPMQGPVRLTDIAQVGGGSIKPLVGLTWYPTPASFAHQGVTARQSPKIDWVIAGGESGSDARPSHPDWFRYLRDQCFEAFVPFFFKQWGEWREFDTGSPIADVIQADDEDNLPLRPEDLGVTKPAFITADGRVYRRFEDLPENVPARLVERVGKRAAGRVLDGRTWDEVPEVA